MLDPSSNGIQRFKILKDVEINRLLLALIYFSCPQHVIDSNENTRGISIDFVNAYIKEVIERFKNNVVELNKDKDIPTETKIHEFQNQARCMQIIFTRLSVLRVKIDLGVYNEARQFLLYLEKISGDAAFSKRSESEYKKNRSTDDRRREPRSQSTAPRVNSNNNRR